jgi:dienelactone hydrolase
MADIIGDRGRRGRGAIPPMAAELRERTMSLHPYAAQKYARAGGTELVAADTVGLVARVLAMRTHARLGVPASAGRRRPVVVFAGGTAHSTDENVALWEHLASHGYVVAAIPTVSMKVGPGYLPDDALGLETIARDFEVALARLRARPDVDSSRVALAGFSFGGAAAIIVAARHRGIGAVVALDASFIARRYQQMLRASPLFDPRRLHAPILEFHRADTATVDLSLLEAAVGSSRTSIELSGLDHVDFNSYVLAYGPLLQQRVPRAARDSALTVKAASYRAMVETTRLFLDEALRGTAANAAGVNPALRAEGPIWARVPATTIRVRHWPGPI